MSRPILQGAHILVVEDQPLIALDISNAFEGTGAQITTTNSLNHAKILVEHDGLSAAILDHALPDGDSTSLCTRLKEREIPFVMFSGYPSVDDACKDVPHLAKPATHEQLLDAVEALLRGRKVPN